MIYSYSFTDSTGTLREFESDDMMEVVEEAQGDINRDPSPEDGYEVKVCDEAGTVRAWVHADAYTLA